MSGEHPHLRPVDSAPESEPGSETPLHSEEASPPSSSAARWWVPALAVGLVVCAGGWFWQARAAAELETRLAATQSALVRSEQRIGALEGHLGSIKTRFVSLQATLQSELEALEGLLATEPGATPAAREPGSSNAP